MELKKAGHEDVEIVAINAVSALDNQQDLIDRCSFPLLQDLPEIDAWGYHHQGSKDDFYIYGRDGKLRHYLPISGDVQTNLSTDEGYDTVKDLLLDVLAEE